MSAKTSDRLAIRRSPPASPTHPAECRRPSAAHPAKGRQPSATLPEKDRRPSATLPEKDRRPSATLPEKDRRPSATLPAKGRPSTAVTEADHAEVDAFNAWMAKYGPVERAIIEARERRLAKKAARRAERPWIFGTLCELTEGQAKAWRSRGLSLDEQIKLAEGDAVVIHFLMAYYGRSMTREIDKMRHQLKRPFYYAAENARRRELAAARRAVRARHTSNPCPTREQVLDAWIHLKDSHEATIRFGSVIEDLACYVDHSLRFDEDGNICGRNGGVKAWLQENIPALALRYSTVMRYKSAAHKLKQITEIADPTPADAIVGRIAQPGLEHGVRPVRHASQDAMNAAKGTLQTAKGTSQAANGEIAEVTEQGAKDTAGKRLDRAEGGEMNNEITLRTKELSVELVRARAIWVEVVTGIKANPTALVARLNELVDPERVADATMLAAWRERYGREITPRTKMNWLRRLLRQIGA